MQEAIEEWGRGATEGVRVTRSSRRVFGVEAPRPLVHYLAELVAYVRKKTTGHPNIWTKARTTKLP